MDIVALIIQLLVLLIVIVGAITLIRKWIQNRRLAALWSNLGPEAPILEVDGLAFRDLNKNGVLDPYEDPRLPVEERVADLLGRMTLEEKAGMMFQTMMSVNKDGTLADKPSMMNPVIDKS